MRQEPTVELNCICPHCGTANTVVQSGLPPGTKVSCSHCAKELGTIEDLIEKRISQSDPEGEGHT